nr:filaggrin-2-like [Penaeus vannamei]
MLSKIAICVLVATVTSLPQDLLSTSYGTPAVDTSGSLREGAGSGIRVASDDSVNESSRDFRIEEDGRDFELGAPTGFADEATRGTSRGVIGGSKFSSGGFDAGSNPAGTSSGSLGPFIPIIIDERQGPDEFGNYNFNFETGNGIFRQEQGAPQGESGAVAQQGAWSFTFPDGTPAEFNFIADENGFRVESDLLPTPPPLPPHAIAQIEKARQEEATGPASGGHEGYSEQTGLGSGQFSSTGQPGFGPGQVSGISQSGSSSGEPAGADRSGSGSGLFSGAGQIHSISGQFSGAGQSDSGSGKGSGIDQSRSSTGQFLQTGQFSGHGQSGSGSGQFSEAGQSSLASGQFSGTSQLGSSSGRFSEAGQLSGAGLSGTERGHFTGAGQSGSSSGQVSESGQLSGADHQELREGTSLELANQALVQGGSQSWTVFRSRAIRNWCRAVFRSWAIRFWFRALHRS